MLKHISISVAFGKMVKHDARNAFRRNPDFSVLHKLFQRFQPSMSFHHNVVFAPYADRVKESKMQNGVSDMLKLLFVCFFGFLGFGLKPSIGR